MTREEIYRDLKQLKRYPEWITFVAHIDSIVQVHKDSSVHYSSKDKPVDASRQAWIAEGMRDAIEEPESVVKSYEFSAKGLYQHVCNLCGQLKPDFSGLTGRNKKGA